MVGDEPLELGDERRPVPALELLREPLLDRRYAELVELSRLRGERGHVAERAAAPECEGFLELTLLEQGAEAERVDVGLCIEGVARRREVDRIRAKRLA